MSCTPFFIIQKPMAKKGEYPEFVVPATEVRGASGLVESTTLDFSVQTFQESDFFPAKHLHPVWMNDIEKARHGGAGRQVFR